MNTSELSILKTARIGQPSRASRFLAALAGSALILGASISTGWAADYNWTGSANATWNTTDTNWSPTATDPWNSTNGITNTANFTGSGSAVVSGTVYNQKINYTAGNGSFTLSGGTISQPANTGSFSVANGGELIVQSTLARNIITPYVNAGNLQGRLIVDANNSSMNGGAGNYLQSGHVILRNNNALGPNGVVTYLYSTTANSPNAAMEFQGGITVNSTMRVEGRGIGGLGVLRVTDGTTNTLSGPLSLYNQYYSTAMRINVDGAGSRLNITGNVTSGGLALRGEQVLEKTGSGTLNLSSGNNTYTGGTTVNAGTLLVNNTFGSGTGTGSVTVNAGARLGGNGTISGATSISGTLAAGNSIGAITTGNLTFSSTGALDVELGRSGVTPVSDLTNVNGTVNLTSGADLKLTLFGGLNTPVLNDIFFLINNDGIDAITGVFTKLNGSATTLNEGSEFSWNSQTWKITYTGDFSSSSFTGGNDLALQVVPEPSTWALLAASLTALLLFRRRMLS